MIININFGHEPEIDEIKDCRSGCRAVTKAILRWTKKAAVFTKKEAAQ